MRRSLPVRRAALVCFRIAPVTKRCQALTGNYSMSQKKAVFDQMKADMENRMIAMKGGINQGYDALVKQPGYEVPDDTTTFR
jgi:hypothetical protein